VLIVLTIPATINADRGQRSFQLTLDQFLAKRGATISTTSQMENDSARCSPTKHSSHTSPLARDWNG
jgi:hypothetical protein